MASLDTTIALVTLDEVREFLKINADTEDSILGELINAASEYANSYTGRQLLKTTFTERYDGAGQMELLLTQYPVVSVTSLYDDISIPAAFASTTLIDSADYLVDLDAGIIRRILLPFYSGVGNVKVTYSAGYVSGSVPSDLRLAVKKIISQQYKTGYLEPRAGIKSITQGDRTTTYKDDMLPKDVTNVLDNYRRMGWSSRSR